MNAITGLPSSGKSTALAFLAKNNFSCFSCDEYISLLYKDPNECKIISNLLGFDDQLCKNIKNNIRKVISKQEKRDLLENYLYNKIYAHLSSNKYDFVEIPVINNGRFDFSDLFDIIFWLEVDEKTRLDRALKRYGDSSLVNFYDQLAKNFNKKNAHRIVKYKNHFKLSDFILKSN